MIAPVQGEGFADIFEGNAYGNGLLPLEMPEAEWSEIAEAGRSEGGVEVTIDLQALTITLHGPSGEKTFAIDVPEVPAAPAPERPRRDRRDLAGRAGDHRPRGPGPELDHAPAGVIQDPIGVGHPGRLRILNFSVEVSPVWHSTSCPSASMTS